VIPRAQAPDCFRSVACFQRCWGGTTEIENLLGIAAAERLCKVWMVRLFGRELALNDDRCFEILPERGFLPNGTPFAVVYLCNIPDA
jgi:hypothetical protein